MLQLGAPIVYTVKDRERAKTKQHLGREVDGSHFHAEMTQFAGVIARVYPDGITACLVIFPPKRPPVTVDHVSEGVGPGQFCPFELAEADMRPPLSVLPVAPQLTGAPEPERPIDDAPSLAAVPAEGGPDMRLFE